LKIEKHIQEDHQAKLVVEFEQQQLDGYRRRAARKLAERGSIPGFRPGKAPYEIILRSFGEAAITERAVDLLVDEEYPAILKEAAIKPATSGTLQAVDSLEPPRLTFLVPLAPEVELGDYHSIRLPYKPPTPSQKELDEAIEDLRQMYATTETVERDVQVGDYVLVDVKSETEGLTRTGFAAFVRKDDRSSEWPFKGFARQLVGMKTGDSKTVRHKFPNDAEDESLRSKNADLEVSVKTVRSVTLPEMDDDFAKTSGAGDTLEALRATVRKDVEARSMADYDDKYFVDLIDKLKQRATIKYAPQTIEHEAEHVLEDLSRRLAQQGLDLPAYYKMRNTDAAKFLEEEARPVARKRLERSLILDEIVRRENIELEGVELDQEFNTTINDLSLQGLDFNKIRGGKQGQQRVAEALAMESANRLLTRRALDTLKAIATGTYQPVKSQGKEAAKDAPADSGSKRGRKKVDANVPALDQAAKES